MKTKDKEYTRLKRNEREAWKVLDKFNKDINNTQDLTELMEDKKYSKALNIWLGWSHLLNKHLNMVK